MEVILTHEQADFDAAGSVLAAWLLDKTRIPVLPKKLSRNLTTFLNDFKKNFPFRTWNTVPGGKITRILLTDTQKFSPVKRLDGVTDVVVCDHHPQRQSTAENPENILIPLGACTTILAEILKQRNIVPGKLEATLMMLGIYEDTGFLSYGSTTPRDIAAAAWLLECGADLDLLRRYIHQPLTEHQKRVCDLLLSRCEEYTVCGQQIMIAMADLREENDEYAAVAHALRDMLNPDGLLLILGTKVGIRIIGRATNNCLNVGELMKVHGGGGHSRAASGLEALAAQEPEDGDEASKEASMEASMEAAMEGMRNRLLAELPDYIYRNDTACGLNLMESLHEQAAPEIFELLGQISALAEEKNIPLYLVGGVVRDLILHRPTMDFDLVMEGDAVCLGKELQSRFGGRLAIYPQFFTANWQTENGHSLDLITARSENYPEPGALPVVTPGKIEDDLRRRDFTINTLAIRLNGPSRGELLDCSGGLADLRAGRIRTLHPLSFLDDPTRIFRAIRFEERFGFQMDAETLSEVELYRERIAALTGSRIVHELRLFCKEPFPERCFSRLAELGLLPCIQPGITWEPETARECMAYFHAQQPDEVRKEGLKPDRFLWVWWSRFPESLIQSLSGRLMLSQTDSRAVLALARLRNEFPGLAWENPSRITFFLDEIPPEVLEVYARIGTEEKLLELLRQYCTNWRGCMPLCTGRDLLARGVQSGPQVGKLLKELRADWIDGKIRSAQEETAWIDARISGEGSCCTCVTGSIR